MPERQRVRVQQQARRQEPQQVQRLRPERRRHPSRRRQQVLREPVRVLLRERVLRAAAAELLYCSPPVSARQARRSVLSVSWFKIPY